MKDSEREVASDKYGKTVRRNFEAEIKARSIYAAQTDLKRCLGRHGKRTVLWSRPNLAEQQRPMAHAARITEQAD